jgi:AMIN domain
VKDFPRKLPLQQSPSRSHLCLTLALGMSLFTARYSRSQTASDSFKPAPENKQFSRLAAASDLNKIAAIKSLRIIQEEDGPAVEVLSTKPLVPSIQALTGPDRLVIDFPNARLETPEKRITVQADEITTLRADMFQQSPPVARVVVDLLAPRAYTWDAAGNRLVVHLGKNPTQANGSPFEPPTVPSVTPGPRPVVAAVRAPGPLALAARDGGSGSTVAAGADTTILSLSSGGEVHVCPGTTVSVTPSQNHHNVMLSLNTGALEAHLALDATSDSVITPDFRILLAGPGEFHYAISADNQGNTCVRALPGNTASAMVSELIGDRTYQVKSTDQLVFRAGQLNRVDMSVPLECGCPPARDAPLRAANSLPAAHPTNDSAAANSTPADPKSVNSNSTAAPSSAETVHAELAPRTGIPATTSASPATPDASAAPNQIHVQLDVPFVFHATGPPPAPVEDAKVLPIDSRPLVVPALMAPLPPGANQKTMPANAPAASANRPPTHGFFKKLGGFFATLFH